MRQALEPAIASVEDGERRWVIWLDTCEHFSEGEASAVRTQVLSQLPATSLIMMAARARPGLAWLTDPGWGELLTPMPLHNLSPTEARTYLSRAGVPESRHDAVVAFTHGHPLSLALVGELGMEPVPVRAERPGEAALLAPSRKEFAQAVRSLLRDLQRPDRLVHNPLLRCRLVEGRLPATAAGADPRPEARLAALREVLQEAVTTLQASPRDAKGFRALRRTYLAPAPSQEVAAQVLGLPSSTYRRHLSAGLQALTDILWERELHA